MLPNQILERIHALALNERDEAAVRGIVSDAMDFATDQAPASKGKAVARTTRPDWPADYRDAFWAKYPNRKAKAHAMKALDKIAFAGKTAWTDLMAGLERYISSPDVLRGFVKHPATWLNAECWKDEDGPTPPSDKPRNPGFFEMIATGE